MLIDLRPALLLAAALFLTGCRMEEEAEGRWGTQGTWPPSQGLNEASQGSVECQGRNDQELLLLWTDTLQGVHLPTSLSGKGLKGSGEIKSAKSSHAITFDSPAEGKGQVTIGGKSYDLSDGRTFYIRHKNGDVEALQLDLDPQRFLDDSDGTGCVLKTKAVDRFVRTDPQFREYFGVEFAEETPE